MCGELHPLVRTFVNTPDSTVTSSAAGRANHGAVGHAAGHLDAPIVSANSSSPHPRQGNGGGAATGMDRHCTVSANAVARRAGRDLEIMLGVMLESLARVDGLCARYAQKARSRTCTRKRARTHVKAALDSTHHVQRRHAEKANLG